MQPQHAQRVTGHEVPAFVEHSVVGQVVLELAGHHPALVEHRDRVARPFGIPVQVSDDGGQRRAAVPGQLGGECLQDADRSGGEGLAQGEVLHRVAGQRHLAEHHQMGAGFGGLPAAGGDDRGITLDVAHGRVHLGQSQTKRRHVSHHP